MFTWTAIHSLRRVKKKCRQIIPSQNINTKHVTSNNISINNLGNTLRLVMVRLGHRRLQGGHSSLTWSFTISDKLEGALMATSFHHKYYSFHLPKISWTWRTHEKLDSKSEYFYSFVFKHRILKVFFKTRLLWNFHK